MFHHTTRSSLSVSLARFVTTGMVAFGLFLAAGPSVRAISFQVSPTRFEFPLTKRFTNFFTLTNNSQETLRVRVYPKFIEIGDGDKIIEKVGHAHDLSTWMVFNPRLVTIRPGQKRTVRFSVRPPKNLSEGEYRAVVFFEELPSRIKTHFKKEQQQVVALRLKLLTRLGVTLYGMIGQPRTGLEVGKESSNVGGEQLTITTPLENTGNVHAQLKIKAALFSEKGIKIHEAESVMILQREQKRNWVFETKRPEPGKYTLVGTVTSEGDQVAQFTVPVEVGPP